MTENVEKYTCKQVQFTTNIHPKRYKLRRLFLLRLLLILQGLKIVRQTVEGVDNLADSYDHISNINALKQDKHLLQQQRAAEAIRATIAAVVAAVVIVVVVAQPPRRLLRRTGETVAAVLLRVLRLAAGGGTGRGPIEYY